MIFSNDFDSSNTPIIFPAALMALSGAAYHFRTSDVSGLILVCLIRNFKSLEALLSSTIFLKTAETCQVGHHGGRVQVRPLDGPCRPVLSVYWHTIKNKTKQKNPREVRSAEEAKVHPCIEHNLTYANRKSGIRRKLVL